MIDHWQWPQFLLAFWWAFTLFARVAVRAAGGRFYSHPPAALAEWWGGTIYMVVNIAALSTILYYGGFWS
jgi:hypothetical protein